MNWFFGFLASFGVFMTTEKWTVLRHSGRGTTTEWRTMFEGSEKDARELYERAYEDMRQGGLKLLRPDGRAEFITWAPRLRTRW